MAVRFFVPFCKYNPHYKYNEHYTYKLNPNGVLSVEKQPLDSAVYQCITEFRRVTVVFAGIWCYNFNISVI